MTEKETELKMSLFKLQEAQLASANSVAIAILQNTVQSLKIAMAQLENEIKEKLRDGSVEVEQKDTSRAQSKVNALETDLGKHKYHGLYAPGQKRECILAVLPWL